MYKEKLKKEKERLAKQGLKVKALKQKDNVNVKFFGMKFKNKRKNLTQFFYM